jgi:hypothetical protein
MSISNSQSNSHKYFKVSYYFLSYFRSLFLVFVSLFTFRPNLTSIMSGLAFSFDVDHYINPFIPRSFLHLLPTPISWLLGHHSKPRPPMGSVLVWFWGFIGAFVGILVIEAVFHTEALQARGTPLVIASFVSIPYISP